MAKIRIPNRNWLLGGVGAALLATAGASASAATVTATYSGYVLSGVDRGGLFGQAGANLTGQAYTAVYTIDTTVGHQTLSPGNYSGVYGGGCCGSPTPVVTSAVLTINGLSDTIEGTDDGGAFVSALGYYPQATTAHHSTGGFQYNKDGFTYNFYQAIYSNAYSDTNSLIGWDYRNSYIVPTTPDVSSIGLFRYDLNHLGPDGRLISDFSTEFRLSGVFDPGPGPGPGPGVPEPATWVTMLGGFAALGAAMRVRRARSRRFGPELII